VKFVELGISNTFDNQYAHDITFKLIICIHKMKSVLHIIIYINTEHNSIKEVDVHKYGNKT